MDVESLDLELLAVVINRGRCPPGPTTHSEPRARSFPGVADPAPSGPFPEHSTEFYTHKAAVTTLQPSRPTDVAAQMTVKSQATFHSFRTLLGV